MSAFTVEMQNTPGQLAHICELLGARGVNLVVCGLAHGNTGTIAFVGDDDATTRSVLRDADIDYGEHEVLTVRLDNVAGAGAEVFRRLAEAGVNLTVFLPIRILDGQFYAVLCAADLDAARAALADVLVTE
jgi:hypothetical protein